MTRYTADRFPRDGRRYLLFVDAEIATDAHGRVLALRARAVSDAGAYHVFPLTQALEPLGSAMILPGPYLTAAYAWEAIAVRASGRLSARDVANADRVVATRGAIEKLQEALQ